jgi:ATP-dependent DNA helicase RecG
VSGDSASPRAADLLRRVARVLRYGADIGGMNLWRLHYLERTVRPMLREVLDEKPPHPGRAAVMSAFQGLEGLDEVPWFERQATVAVALKAVTEAQRQDAGPPAATHVPRGELIEIPDIPEPSRAPSPAPEAKPAAAVAKSPAPPQRAALGDPRATGKPLSSLEGVSEGLAARFQAAGVETIADLLSLLPSEHERVQLHGGGPLEEGYVALPGVLRALYTVLSPMGKRSEGLFEVQGRLIRCSWMQEPLGLTVGDDLTFVGELELEEDGAVLFEPQRWWANAQGEIRQPVYGITGVDDGTVRRVVRAALAQYGGVLLDPLPRPMRQAARIREIGDALQQVHLPSGPLESGRTRAVFVELLVHQLAAARTQQVRHRGIAHTLSHEPIATLQDAHGLELTDIQEIVFTEIRRDLRKPKAMTRLLQGDVGSGKATLSLLTALMVALAKAQVCFLAPTAIAAEHRYLFAEPILRQAGLVPQLITSRPSAAQIDAVRRGEASAVFATHALLQDFPEFKKLGLVIVEERDVFGVVDRAKLTQKGVHPDLLVVTSVPIPVSLTFTAFSDHDLSVLSDPPRQTVEGRLRPPEQRMDTYAELVESVERGRQAYVVFPMRRGQDLLDLHDARSLLAALKAEAFPGLNVALYHGSMSRDERFRVFEDFQRRRLDVLVATTGIEDAPEVSNATYMVVENADRYDQVRLHRLRGHVAQGRTVGTCTFVLSQNPTAEGRALVERVAAEQDGFAIAERDRQARGDAALLGGRADGLPEFKVADPSRDRDLLLRARRAALDVLQRDPELRQRNNAGLLRLVSGEGAGVTDDPPPKPKRRPRGRRRRKRGNKKGAGA